MHALLASLLLARLMHPIGMLAPVGSPRQFAFRGVSVIVTWLVLVAAAVLEIAKIV